MRPLCLLTCVLLVVAVPELASAKPQAEQAGRGRGFRFYSGGLLVGVDSSIITDEGTTEDIVFSVVPTAIAYTSRSLHSALQFIYEPQFDIYATHSRLNAFNQAAAAAYSLRATRNFSLRTGGSFLRTNDRSRQSVGLAFSPRGLHVEGRAYFSVDYRVSRDTSVRAGVDSAFSQTTFVQSASGSLEELTSSFAAGLSRRFGSRHQVSVGYAHLGSTFLNPGDLPPGEIGAARQGQDALDVDYDLSFPSGLRVGGSVGAIRLPQPEANDQYTYAWSGRIDKSWSWLTINGSYRRSLSGLFRLDSTPPSDQIRDPLLSRSVAEYASIRVAGQFGRRLTISHELGASRTFLQGFNERLDAIIATFYAEVVVADRLVTFVNLWYWDQNATVFTDRVSRTRIGVGLRFYWDSPPATRGGSDQESARSILPFRRVG